MFQPTVPPLPSPLSFAGRTILITGGNAGLGLEGARQFLALGASRIIITTRTPSKSSAAIDTLRADPAVKAANSKAIIEAFELDLDDYTSVLSFCQRVKREVQELDVLLNNAGMNQSFFELTKSGHERVMQVNCYSSFLIALELLPLLQATARKRAEPTRLSWTGSGTQTMHTLAKAPIGPSVIGYFDDKAKYSGLTRYQNSKLAVYAFVQELSKRVPAEEVIVNNFCPGMVATDFDKNSPAWIRGIMYFVRKVVARDIETGGRTVVYGAGVAGGEGHGRFVQHSKVAEGAKWLEEDAGKEFAGKLWKEVVDDVAKVDPELKRFA